MKLAKLKTLALALLLTVFAPAALAGPITFVYNCTVNGTGDGTNNCSAGPTVASVTIEQAAGEPDGVLRVSAEWLGDTAHDYTLNTIWLNMEEDLIGDLPFVDGPGSNDYNSMEFSFDVSFSDPVIIEVLDDQIDDSNYKGFDLQLCGSNNDSCGSVALVDEGAALGNVTVGYIRSGSGFVLDPMMFLAVTENSGNVNNPDEIFALGACDQPMPGGLYSMIQADPATSGTNDQDCGMGGYGPRYGAYEVPEPGSLALLTLGLLGLALSRRRKV